DADEQVAAPDSFFFFSSRRRHTRSKRDWSSDVCSSDLLFDNAAACHRTSRCTFPKDRPVVPVSFSTADEHLKRIRDLPEPSTIRSEERRVGKEGRYRATSSHDKSRAETDELSRRPVVAV